MKFIIFIFQRKLGTLLCLLLIDAGLFGLTDVKTVSSFMLAVGFVLLSATFYYLIYAILSLAQLAGLTIKHQRRFSLAVTALIACLVAFQSSGELNLRDIVVLVPLVIIGYGYSFYGKAASKTPDL